MASIEEMRNEARACADMAAELWLASGATAQGWARLVDGAIGRALAKNAQEGLKLLTTTNPESQKQSQSQEPNDPTLPPTHANSANSSRPNRTLAQALAAKTWEALPVKPVGARKFIIWRQRIEEALDAGATEALVLAAAPMAGVTQPSWDTALRRAREAAAPRPPTVQQERTQEAQAARARDAERRRGDDPQRADPQQLLAGIGMAKKALVRPPRNG